MSSILHFSTAAKSPRCAAAAMLAFTCSEVPNPSNSIFKSRTAAAASARLVDFFAISPCISSPANPSDTILKNDSAFGVASIPARARRPSFKLKTEDVKPPNAPRVTVDCVIICPKVSNISPHALLSCFVWPLNVSAAAVACPPNTRAMPSVKLLRRSAEPTAPLTSIP